jgi:hypothetical protein
LIESFQLNIPSREHKLGNSSCALFFSKAKARVTNTSTNSLPALPKTNQRQVVGLNRIAPEESLNRFERILPAVPIWDQRRTRREIVFCG